MERLEDDSPDTPMEDKEELPDLWILFTDRSSCIDSSKAGLILTNPKRMEFTYALRFGFKATNNEAEYEALIASLRITEQMEEILPEEKKKARAVRRKARSMHAGPRSVVAKALRSGYYWPTMHVNARKLIRECNDCQGIDIAGPFLEGLGIVKFLIVAIDYFTMWIEAKPVATISGAQIKKFMWDNIVCRFGFPGEIISDNEKQFRDNPFKDWSLGEGIKARLDERSKNWLEEISHVIWGHRTMIKFSNGETPFSLTYGKEAVIPVEIGMPTLRTAKVNMIKMMKLWESTWTFWKKKENKQQSKKQKVKPKWKNTIMPGFVTQASGKETLSTETIKQAMWKKEASSDLSGKDHMKSHKL
ncbi:reverse transcriptase domain-containing protein [Tanacetum coccineum]